VLEFQREFKVLLDEVYSASNGIRVIDPHDKAADNENIAIARTQIANASRIYILGYGFDEHNSERLNLRGHLAYGVDSKKFVSFTNFGDINQVNKRASNVFFGNQKSLPPGVYSAMDRYEKSNRNVYDALQLDFDLPE
jgi:hypothetical protein